MKLTIEEHISFWNDRFTVRDEAGDDRFRVEGEKFSFGRKLHVYDLEDREVAYVEQQIWTLLPRYEVYLGEQHIGDVVREFSLFRPHYYVEGAEWDVRGDFGAHDYAVYDGETTVATISKEWFTWGDCYTLDIADPQNELGVLALVLAIDCAMEESN